MVSKREREEAYIRELQDYLGPRVSFSTETRVYNRVDRWLLDYLDLLKRRKYRELARKRTATRRRRKPV